jgi:hypothetical protein
MPTVYIERLQRDLRLLRLQITAYRSLLEHMVAVVAIYTQLRAIMAQERDIDAQIRDIFQLWWAEDGEGEDPWAVDMLRVLEHDKAVVVEPRGRLQEELVWRWEEQVLWKEFMDIYAAEADVNAQDG